MEGWKNPLACPVLMGDKVYRTIGPRVGAVFTITKAPWYSEFYGWIAKGSDGCQHHVRSLEKFTKRAKDKSGFAKFVTEKGL